MPTPAPLPVRTTRKQDVADGPLYCPELDRWLPLDLTIAQAAARDGKSERTAYRAAKSGAWVDLCIRITGGDIGVATAPLLRRYGLTISPKTEAV